MANTTQQQEARWTGAPTRLEPGSSVWAVAIRTDSTEKPEVGDTVEVTNQAGTSWTKAIESVEDVREWQGKLIWKVTTVDDRVFDKPSFAALGEEEYTNKKGETKIRQLWGVRLPASSDAATGDLVNVTRADGTSEEVYLLDIVRASTNSTLFRCETARQRAIREFNESKARLLRRLTRLM